MKKSQLSILAIISLMGITGCNNPPATDAGKNNPDNGNKHHWSDVWTKTETKHWRECTDSGCNEKDSYGDHDYDVWVIDTYADITHDASGNDDIVNSVGTKHRDCKVCGYRDNGTHTDEAPLGDHTHTYDNVWQYDESYHWHQCSYGKTQGYGGKDKYVCSEKSSYGAHSWGQAQRTKEPTTTSEGIDTYTCSTCGATKQTTVPKTTDTSDSSEVITVAFNELSGKQVTVNPKIKAYVDAMRAAEPNVTNPYHMQPLQNGVDVCDYLDKTDYPDVNGQGHNKPQGVTLSWNKGSMDYTTAIVKFSTNSDMSDAREAATKGNSVTITNLYSNAKYYYQLTYTKNNKSYKSNIATFETADYTRFIDLGLVYNVRDMGNYKTSFGGRTKQGLIYRGSELTPYSFTDYNGSHPANIDADVLDTQKNVLKIGVEIDHRNGGEANGIVESPLGNDVEYKRDNYTVSAYNSFVTGDNSTDIKNIFNAFANADQKHVYFHCIGGADRTGCVAFTLGAILGMSYTDLIMDFEYTTETNWPRCRFTNDSAHYSRFPDFYNAFTKFNVGGQKYDANKTVCENAVNFLKGKGVTEATIEKIRSIMIEGYSSGSGSSEQQGGNNDNPPPVVTHEHSWGSETKVSTSGVDLYKSSCSCGKKKISFLAKDGTLASGSTNNNSNGYVKLKSNGNSISYSINLPEAVNGTIYFYGYMDTWGNNGSKSYFSGNSVSTTKADENGNFTLKIDGSAVDFSHMKGTTYAEIFTGNGSNSDEGYAEIGAVNLSAGAHNVVFTRVDSYNVTVKNFIIIY